MREIRFRGKRVDNGDWVFGYYAKDINYDMNGSEYIDCIIDTAKGTSEGMWLEVSPATVGQFTELLDKNGKEIYEGDIVKEGPNTYKLKIGEVVYDKAEFAIRFPDISYIQHGLLGSAITYIEVIGNIHTHPHLLERSEPNA